MIFAIFYKVVDYQIIFISEVLHMSGGIVFTLSLGDDSPKIDRTEKGKNIIDFPEQFVVIDLETTGLDPSWDGIIEVSGIRVKNGIVIDKFTSLINPGYKIDEFITELTGITNDMLAPAPKINDVLPLYLDFIGTDIVVGHNVNFDVNFLYDYSMELLQKPFTNSFIDTMRMARKVFPEYNHHRLCDIKEYLNVSSDTEHRAESDCMATLECYLKMKTMIEEKFGLPNFIEMFKNKKIDLRTISTNVSDFDTSHPLYGKRCVFTGTLEKMTRAEAAQHVVDLGGIADNNVTKKTNFLVLGNNDYCKSIKDGKSTKQKKAEQNKLSGCDIEIITENVFYDMIEV